jgi:hypothetical protein
MTVEENLRLQHLFEDSMATLTATVEWLSHALSSETAMLEGRVNHAVSLRAEDPAAVRGTGFLICSQHAGSPADVLGPFNAQRPGGA